MRETSYGDAKRLAFLRGIIESRRPATVLDIGCGTGAIALTLPNGYGPFEAMALTECVLHLSGLQSILRWLKYRILGKSVSPRAADLDTLAVSPHVNFFGFDEITNLFEAAGFNIVRSANRTALCG